MKVRFLACAVFCVGISTALAAAELPFLEDFSSVDCRDAGRTTAAWDVADHSLRLARPRPLYGVGEGGFVATNLDGDVVAHPALALATGDVDGDGDIDVVVGNDRAANRLYLNNGTDRPFVGVAGRAVTSDADMTTAVALGDVDGDGDLDLVAGNYGTRSRLYLNNGTDDPFAGVTGHELVSDVNATRAAVLGDVDGDGDLDVVLGMVSYRPNLLFLNNGTAGPFSGVSGTPVSADAFNTFSIALGDVDGDGDLDVVSGDYDHANRLYLNNGTGDPFAGVSGRDVTPDRHTTYAVTVGDVDGDGDLDVVAGNSRSANRLYLNNGTTDPFARTTGRDVGLGANATRALVLGDVDGDGDLDLFVGNGDDTPDRLVLNNGSDDPFGTDPGVSLSLWGEPGTGRCAALGDLDGDGDLDAAAATSGSYPTLYFNRGTPNPYAGGAATYVSPASRITKTLTWADLDRDGDLDLMVGNYGQTNELFLNNGTTTPFEGVTGAAIGGAAYRTEALAVGDVNGDGRPDVVEGNYRQSIRLYLHNGTANPFSGVVGGVIATDVFETTSLVLGDVDGDGDLDVATGNYNGRNRLYLNNGTVTPFAGVVGRDIGGDAQATTCAAFEDIDGDGDLDFIEGNLYGVNRVFLNNGTADPFAAVTGAAVTADTDATVALAVGDVDGDGDMDLVAGKWAQVSRLYLNNGTASPFAAVTGRDVASEAEDVRGVSLADVDRDGDLDLVVASTASTIGGNLVYLNTGPRALFGSVRGLALTDDRFGSRALALGDADGDGDLDLAAGDWSVTTRYYTNGLAPLSLRNPEPSGTGTPPSSQTRALAVGDVDGDGDPDLVVGNYNQVNRVYLGTGGTAAFDGTSRDISADVFNTRAVALGDLDGDGDLDLVCGNLAQVNRWYRNNGTADPFAGVVGADISTDLGMTYAVALGDVDGDGDLDLVAGNQGQRNRLYMNNGTTTPFTGVTGIDITGDEHATVSVALGDVNGDGGLDIVAGNYNAVCRLYLNNGTAMPFSEVVGVDISTDLSYAFAVVFADMDRDGHLDLVVGNGNGYPDRLYLNNGTPNPFQGVTALNISADLLNTSGLAIGDLDGDGDPDVLTANYNQPCRLYRNNGTANPFAGVTGSDVESQALPAAAIALGDMDRNGRLDAIVGSDPGGCRWYRWGAVDTSRGTAVSRRVAGDDSPIPAATLRADTFMPPHAAVTWYLSNNGGARWHRVDAGREFVFPSFGSDLRWKAELHSLSPARTPRIITVSLLGPVGHVITSTSGPHGRLIPSGAVYVPQGASRVFTVDADPYYHLADVLINGSSIGPLAPFRCGPLTADLTAHATFAPDVAARGTPHWWLARYGWTSGFDAAEFADPDGDRLAAWQEYVADTDPTNGASAPRIVALSGGPPVRAHFRSSTNCVYSLQWTESAGGKRWHTVDGASNAPGSGGFDSFPDATSSAPGIVRRFYRLTVGRR